MRTVLLIVTVELYDDDDRTDEQVRSDVAHELDSMGGAIVDLPGNQS